MRSFTKSGERIRSGWVIARVFGARQLPIRFAHTSPIYVDMPEKSLDASEDAAYFAKWIRHRLEGLDGDANFKESWQREAVRKQLREAAAVYERMIRK